MKIFKIIADKRPECCLLCPIIRQQKGKCGTMVKRKSNGWEERYKAPDERCLIEIRKAEKENVDATNTKEMV